VKKVALGDVLAEARPGFACGEEDPDGVFQFRMHNVSKSSDIDLGKRRRVPRSAHRQLDHFLVEPDDVLFNATNSPDNVGKSILVPRLDEPAVFSNHFIRLRPKAGLTSTFLWRWLQWRFQRGEFSAICRQWVNQATVSREALLASAISLPPLDEQRRIAEILDQADRLRAIRRRAMGLAESLRAAIFLEMFGDPGEPRAPRQTVKFGEIAELQGGRNLVADDSDAIAPFQVLKISAVTAGTFKPWEAKPLPVDYIPPDAHLVRQGDLLISRANTAELVGAVAYVDSSPPNLVLPDKIWRFVWKDPASVPLYYWALFRTPAMRRRISQLSSGTGGSMKNISKAKLEQLELPYVDVARQDAFRRRLAAIPSPAVTEFDELFTSLQSRAFSGQL